MADDASVQEPQPPQTPSSPSDATASTESTVNREELLEKARAFLHSPQVQHEDAIAKRRFLTEKGLSQVEIDGLLQELPPQIPLVPPRTYPQPSPSNLPNLLVGAARIVSWVAGGSVTLLLIYFRFLYPRIAQTFHARHSLRTHQRDLLGKLTNSLTSLKETQSATFAVLPHPEPYKDAQYGHCHTLDELVAASEGRQDIPDSTLLRCGIADLTAQGQKATTEVLFHALDTKFAWLADSAEGTQHDVRISVYPQSSHVHSRPAPDAPLAGPLHKPALPPRSRGRHQPLVYAAPAPPSPVPLLSSLGTLKHALPAPAPDPALSSTPRAHTLQALADLTGYIATQTYTGFRTHASGFGAALPAEGEDVRREIRALKGLVLNRRTFMPNAPRPAPPPPPPPPPLPEAAVVP
ncbi:hypothetical protein B0H21DRAFT_707808 [Amylocystis lapponica]|nr:hypothetical protein B0H21DRAFT_707808 [Amylocystis lapponica]